MNTAIAAALVWICVWLCAVDISGSPFSVQPSPHTSSCIRDVDQVSKTHWLCDIKHVFGDLSPLFCCPKICVLQTKENQHPALELIRVYCGESSAAGRRVVAAQLARLIGLTAKPSRDIDLEIGEARAMAPLCFLWHESAFGLWADATLSLFDTTHTCAHTHAHMHFSKRETLAARSVWRHTLTETHKHTQRATLISCLASLSGVRHSWGDRAILWTTGHTNNTLPSSPLL